MENGTNGETTINGVDEVDEYQRKKGRRTSLTPGRLNLKKKNLKKKKIPKVKKI